MRDSLRLYWLAWLLIAGGELVILAGIFWSLWGVIAGALLLTAGLILMSVVISP